jgi:hypothetical protein
MKWAGQPYPAHVKVQFYCSPVLRMSELLWGALVQKVGAKFNADQLNILKVNTDEESQLASAYRVQVRIFGLGFFHSFTA